MDYKIALVAALTTLMAGSAQAYYGNEPYCREYTQHFNVGGRIQEGYGTACMQPDGSWEIQTPAQVPGMMQQPPAVMYAPQFPPRETVRYVVEERYNPFIVIHHDIHRDIHRSHHKHWRRHDHHHWKHHGHHD